MSELSPAQKALNDLENRLGEVFEGEWLTITQEMVNQFAETTLDKQWIHIETARAAQESPYGTTIAHGFLTLSLIPYLAGGGSQRRFGYEGLQLGVNYGLNRVRFPEAVRVGSQLRARDRLMSVKPVSEGVLELISEVTIDIADRPKPACVAERVSRLYFSAST
ncbi:MAG: MaoC family dehydratase [Deinococcales bacterium]